MKKLFSILLAACLLLSVCAGALAEDKKVIDHTAYSQFPLVKDGEKLTITVAHIRDAAYGVDVEKMWFWKGRSSYRRRFRSAADSEQFQG